MMKRSILAFSTVLTALAAHGAAAQDVTGAIGDASENTLEAEIVPLPTWHAERVYADGWSVEQLLGADVSTALDSGEQGDVENVVFDQDGKVLSIVAELGGFFELGDTHVNIPWSEVEYDPTQDHVVIPVTAENVEDYSVFDDTLLMGFEAANDIVEVTGDGVGEVEIGPRLFRATDLLQDYARLNDGGSWVNYGTIDDIIVQGGNIAAVVVRPDAAWGATGAYAYPYYDYGWTSGSPYYDLPYDRRDIESVEPMDYANID